MEDWLNRKRPGILGKEGAAIALNTFLADILNRPYDEDSFLGDAPDENDNGWVDGIGEGRTDEDTAYFRMSEVVDGYRKLASDIQNAKESLLMHPIQQILFMRQMEYYSLVRQMEYIEQ